MRIPAIIEWRGGAVGWWGAVHLPNGLEITINSGHSPTVIRKRLRRALVKAGIKTPVLEESVRIPQELVKEIEGLKKFRARADLAAGEFVQERLRVAKRLLTEIHLTEMDVAGLLGIAQSHLSNQLAKDTTDTGEYVVGSRASPRVPTSKPPGQASVKAQKAR
jgi:hypothetical protein